VSSIRRNQAWLLAIVLVTGLFAPVNAQTTVPFTLHDNIQEAIGLDKIRLLGAISLSPLASKNPEVTELSGLAWDADEQLLYAVTDRGYLLHFQPQFEHQNLASAKLLNSFQLKDKAGRVLRDKNADSEGLAGLRTRNGIRGDSELLVSFERNPRLQTHTPRGRFVRVNKHASKLGQSTNYRSANKGMEAVTVHPLLGVLTSPEWSLRDDPLEQIVIYSARGERARLPRLQHGNAGLVALQALPDGSLLILERAHSWLSLSLVVELSRTDIVSADLPTNTTLTRERLARFDSSLGWRVDNFEGLTQHTDKRYFMVSDDNGSAIQTTILVYFELL
jgi:hypothetical protein